MVLVARDMDKIEAIVKDVAGIIIPNIKIEKDSIMDLKASLMNVVHCLKEIGLDPSIHTSLSSDTAKTKIGSYIINLINCCILLLNQLSEISTKEYDDQDSDLLRHTECILQFVLKFGIVGFLEPNLCQNQTLGFRQLYDHLSLREKYAILLQNTSSFIVFCQNPIFRKITTEKWLTNIIAALMQLCFSPSSSRLLDIKERKFCLQGLNVITESWISKKRLTEELILLQGNMSNRIVPKWLQSKCGLMLSRILLEKDGVEAVVTTMILNFENCESGRNWEQIIALSSIISTLPSKGSTSEQYCELVCPQLMQLLKAARNQSGSSSETIARVAVTSIHALHEKYPQQSAVFEKLICDPLSRCCDSNDCDITDCQVSNCIENLHQICISVGVVPESLLTLLIQPYLSLLFCLMFDLRQTSSHIVSLSKDLIQNTIKSMKQEEAAELVLALYGENVSTQDLNKLKVPCKGLSFVLTEDSEIKPVLNCGQSEPSEVLQQQDVKVNMLLDLLSTLGHDSLIGNVFILLLKCLCDPSKNIPQQVANKNSLLTDMDKATLAMENNSVRFITFGLLTSMCESFEPSILLSDISQIITFIKMVLENLLSGQEQNEYKENLGVCLSVLGICLMSDMSTDEKKELSSMVPIMQKLCDKERLDAHTKELISDLTIAISTYGAVNETSIDMFSKVMKDQMEKFENLNINKNDIASETKTDTPVVVAHKSSTADDTCIGTDTQSEKVNDKEPNMNDDVDTDIELSFNEAMEAVFDTCPAIKGGSIRYITKCIKQKLHVAMEKLEKITQIFIESLDCDDSFVYLSAVQGLATIANTETYHLASKGLLDKLVSKFLHDSAQEVKHKESSNATVLRMKLGEIIMRIVRELGDLGPHHASILLPEFLKGSRHANPDMRASCLSNFAGLAPMGPHFLTKIQHEVSDCLCAIARTDTDEMVRRAAIHAIHQLITKLEDKFLRVFPDTTKEFYRAIKLIYERDSDNVMQLHAQLALEELNEIMRTNIFQQPKLTKKITVLPS